MRPAHTPIGVDVGRRMVKAVQLTRDARGWHIAAACVYPRAQPGGAPDEHEVRRLCGVLERQGFRGRQVVLAAPAPSLVVEAVEVPPRSSGAPIEQIARVELARVTKLDPDSFEMAAWDLPAPARAGSGAHMLAVALPRTDADACLDLFEGQGLAVQALDTQAWAMARACRLRAAESSPMIAALDLGWGGALLVLVHNGQVIYQRTLAAGELSTLVADLSKQTGLPLEAIEQLLAATGQSPETPAALAGSSVMRLVTQHYLETTAAELAASLSYATHRYPETPVSRVVVMGGGAGIQGLCGQFAAHLGVPVEPLRPTDVAACPVEIEERCRHSLASLALGLALHSE